MKVVINMDWVNHVRVDDGLVDGERKFVTEKRVRSYRAVLEYAQDNSEPPRVVAVEAKHTDSLGDVSWRGLGSDDVSRDALPDAMICELAKSRVLEVTGNRLGQMMDATVHLEPFEHVYN